MNPVRVLVVDDHQLIRLGLRLLLEGEPEIAVAGEAATGAEALQAVAALRPDIVALDVRLPDQSGIEVCRAIKGRWPQIKVLILTAYDDEDLILRAVEAGADGYVLKQLEGPGLIQALRQLAQGGSALDPMTARALLVRMRRQAKVERQEALRDLTERERQVLALLAQGHDNCRIAAELHLSEKTVRNYVTAILDKLGVANRAQAVAYVLQHGLLDVLTAPGRPAAPGGACSGPQSGNPVRSTER